jgi:Zn-dependent oligopeptidase
MRRNPDNPLLKKWTGPYGGVPAFNEYNISQIKPAFDVVIKERLSELRRSLTIRRRPLLKTRLLKWNAPVVILSVS